MKSQGGLARRPYRMRARAEATAATGERIIDAAVELFWERPTMDISLEEVARRAGVSVQTVIRRFGGKAALLAAGAARESTRVDAQRFQATPGDIPGAVSALVAHYEDYGERVLRMLAEEERVPALTPVVDEGRKVHLEWCTRMFAGPLERRVGVERQRLFAQLVAVCDVYVWKLLRRDARLSRRQTELAICELLNGLLGGA